MIKIIIVEMIKQRVSVGTLEKQSLTAHAAESEYERRQLWKLQRQRRANRNLLVFSALILLLPLGIYFASLWGYFGPGREVWAALCAVIAANVVLVGYVAVAMVEPDEMPHHHGNEASNHPSPTKSSSPLYPIQEDVVALQNYSKHRGSEREVLYMDDDRKLD